MATSGDFGMGIDIRVLSFRRPGDRRSSYEIAPEVLLEN